MKRYIIAALAVGGFYMLKLKSKNREKELNLKHFTPSEFGAWWLLMSKKQLLTLDKFREALGKPIIISPAKGSLGRYLGSGESSQHNVSKWGEVRASDIMFPWMTTKEELRHAVEVAKRVGFTGIGAYPHWKPYMGLHVDVREDRQPGNPALWSAIVVAGNQKYVGLDVAFA